MKIKNKLLAILSVNLIVMPLAFAQGASDTLDLSVTVNALTESVSITFADDQDIPNDEIAFNTIDPTNGIFRTQSAELKVTVAHTSDRTILIYTDDDLSNSTLPANREFLKPVTATASDTTVTDNVLLKVALSGLSTANGEITRSFDNIDATDDVSWSGQDNNGDGDINDEVDTQPDFLFVFDKGSVDGLGDPIEQRELFGVVGSNTISTATFFLGIDASNSDPDNYGRGITIESAVE